ncbi:DNA-directed RNA polymerase subunit M [Morus notabilis]|uniref:DNA-directed RNA polymerase subunit n=1 Tax=Morus notabilis TaxID=981085 RepID=W9RDF5_9ROSA|nr:DNA-directed RNA polymerase III subunit RPC10 [Morus notabilis]EXB83864.1 DNA-directed RNA polymerase subunit M [Morus notabilis]
MEFCPTCGVMLLYELPDRGRSARFYCPTCPYVCSLESRVKIKRRQHLVKKEIEPVFSQNDLTKGPQTDVTCPKCGYGKAAYETMQTRSADEPETIFYACLEKSCGHIWRD